MINQDNASLAHRIVRPVDGSPPSHDDLLSAFLDWAASKNLELYPAQEEAILELFEGRHVILNTPTGSGKSLVALALCFLARATGRTVWYTSPVKALVNEKFFDLCDQFGPDAVGLVTGDATINRDAPIVCCTAEILANLCLREGADAPVDDVVMDEFHYYGDRERGVAWQLPLLILEKTRFLLMSATLGDTHDIVTRLEKQTGRQATLVTGTVRPVPLEFSYRLTALHETVNELVHTGKAPIYLVNFTQRACAEQAQNLTSQNLCTREEKERIKEALRDFRFDTPYGKELERFVRHGIGIHHGGLVPKYRRLIERLAQQNLLKVVSGTDTLGVGVNVPLRTVLFTQLCKFDGEKMLIVPVRDFHQIAGRAGRKGFDDRGWVVAQAPEHVIENLVIEAKAAASGKKKVVKKKPPEKGYVHFDEQTFLRLQEQQPETLQSRFEISHAMILNILQRPKGGYRAVLELLERAHLSDYHRRKQKRRAAQLVRSLRLANIVRVVPSFNAWPKTRSGSKLEIDPDLQANFSLNQAIALWLVEAVALLDPESETFALDVLSLVEATLENPRVVLFAQINKLKGEKVAELKASGVEYDERMEQLEKVDYPKPLADFIYDTFNSFAEHQPWAEAENVRPKSIARDIWEHGSTFHEYIRDLKLERSEGVLLRYLTDAWRTLQQTVPEQARTEAVLEQIEFLRGTVRAVDSSLIDEWEAMRDPDALVARAHHVPAPPKKKDPAADPRMFAARVRTELQLVVRALAARQWEEALRGFSHLDEEWTPGALEKAIEPLVTDHGGLDTTPRSRAVDMTFIRSTGHRQWDVVHKLLAKDGEDTWMLDCEIDLSGDYDPEAPLMRLRRLGS